MKEHISSWYESFDGKRFESEDDCMMYEVNEIYKKSGVRLYTKGMRLIENLNIFENDDGIDSYDCTEYVVIDRSKEKENKEFCELVHLYCGWYLIEEAIEAKGTKYKLEMTEIKEVK